MNRKLDEYRRKRDFTITQEPDEEPLRKPRQRSALSFVIQKHAARRLHYDFRLELDGTLKSWAVPKGPSLDPRDKRLAVHVEDHPLDYGSFEGSIPAGQYGAGDVIVWDRGIWQPHGDPHASYQSGKLKFSLQGEKLAGDWTLVRTHLRGSGDKEQWLLIKERDPQARSADEYNIVEALPDSVLSEASIPAKASKPSKPAKSPAPRKKRPAGPAVPLPDILKPALATLVDRPPPGDWHYEIKFDGYRILARKQGRHVRLYTRNGHDWTERLPLQAKALATLYCGDAWLDGEVVVLGDNGLPDFQALQNAFERNAPKDIIFYLFDAPFLNGEDLREQPVEQRRAALRAVMENNRSATLRFSEDFSAAPQDIIESACALKLEGIIGKRAGSSYVSRRTPEWIKLKCRLRQEFVIIGFSKPKGSRSGFGALLLGVHEKGELRYAGRVGTGFNETRLRELHARLKERERPTPPLDEPPTGADARDVHWVEPELVAEVEFAEWTREGVVRQASFIALRSDKPAREIGHETPQPAENLSPRRDGKVVVAGVPISNPQRVIDPESGGRKQDLARFYADIAHWILPFLNDRPVSLVRAPDGVEGEQFFQKHAERLSIPNIRHLDQSLDPGHSRLMEIDSLKALIGAVQMGTIELHTWGATHDAIETPDLFVLDLDPDPALPWRSMQEAAQLCLSVLDELGLDAYLKTSGGKGLHIIVPLQRKAGWDEVKTFSKAFARFMAQQLPDRFSATSGPKNRIGKIFIDYLRNNRGSSTVCAYSVRARPGLAVSVPIVRDELHDLHGAAQWTIFNLRERLDALEDDPWQGYENRQTLTAKMWKQLGAKPPR
ncbi:ATP-dependent DNA ligase [Pseudomonas flexibilis]|uniref:DNA ligase (ATP) n=1 Tax=Pseudomonas flexibilis TaxID=706570 RepID=A0A1N6PHD0_9PSED|nr:DNA ligase D [Pseudomonas flexibilis]KHL70036.1 ATP-dependent DNA ligase [Pseudomonas flexibilis]SIQ03703.1 ATP-dependent DNA ligase LigD phosphoesterase module /ATP-dependent DNA ligase LigD polymerase module [Pseudomonas flexibilis]